MGCGDITVTETQGFVPSGMMLLFPVPAVSPPRSFSRASFDSGHVFCKRSLPGFVLVVDFGVSIHAGIYWSATY